MHFSSAWFQEPHLFNSEDPGNGRVTAQASIRDVGFTMASVSYLRAMGGGGGGGGVGAS